MEQPTDLTGHVMNCWGKIAILLLTVATIQGGAQSASEGQVHVQETQTLGYWVDPSTRLMWAGKDNGENINWKKAVKYCRDMRLVGYSDCERYVKHIWQRSERVVRL